MNDAIYLVVHLGFKGLRFNVFHHWCPRSAESYLDAMPHPASLE
ncbi:hypothetical protein BIFCAT_01481 [Bifidobacterium catenulatum DSM 16992 = JCM 1194 = LMG 11043]|uniref:Uncharacterized protein n=1 Tax=Bifidobacterium catenulatum DSM 16992 = JCM 1194 = LMG 11043 TaxID=566552 RepID=B6XW91_9BIFI|nr:hypothetical protein BIFCAT_01481 [Bifidobacterium catenulatum DSM 16992 = JCM 1194 = LMG 11043]